MNSPTTADHDPTHVERQPSSGMGVVIIGRNEGQRLVDCIESVRGLVEHVVYVDSGSTDDSVAAAQVRGVEVVELDLSVNFTAARARNAGFQRLIELDSDLAYVQFVDGDCQVIPGWLQAAQDALQQHPDVSTVCGRRREIFPDKTVYNLMCDIEWNTPLGERPACGGDAMMRVAAVQQVGGYDPDVIAAEDDELCLRLRMQGWKVLRIDHDMTYHDAAMDTFGQWWQRMKRGGHAYAQGRYLHGRTRFRHFVRQTRSIWFWALGVPIIILVLSVVTKGWAALLLLIYPLQTARSYFNMRRAGLSHKRALPYSIYCMLAKFPQLCGQLNFLKDRFRGRQSKIIEYK